MTAALVGGTALAAEPSGPSFSCARVEPGGIERMICTDPALSALDRKLAGVYGEAARKVKNEHPPSLKAEQRGWIKGRNDCWKADDRRACVEEQYRLRIAELQAKHRLVPAIGPVRFACDGQAANALTATFFETDPPTMIAERGDAVSLMIGQPAASGARYQGRNESFWEHQGEARVTWGYGTPEMTCRKAP
ncbi:MliC family protein [Azospirillum brasilense]|uniref:MliC family protein n=1 Tax=Azospirillum brasilense TaxID=192 RepID=UPI00190AFBF1|nr:MliC family protein [Azospirillum brasilense]